MPFSNVKSTDCNGIELALLEGFSGRDNGTQAPPSGQTGEEHLATQTAGCRAKRIIAASFQDRNVLFLMNLTRLFYVWC